MRRSILLLLSAALWVGAAASAQIRINLDHLSSKASDVVDINLDSTLIQIGTKLLSDSDPDQARVKQIAKGLRNIRVKIFDFKSDGAYSPGDVQSVRGQLQGPGWSRVFGVNSKEEGQNAEVYLGSRGLAIIISGPRELAVVALDGTINLEQLSELGGHFGIPEMKVEKKPKKD